MNIANRAWRILLGSFLTTWAVAGGPSWGFLGVILMLSGSFGFTLLGVFHKSRDSDF